MYIKITEDNKVLTLIDDAHFKGINAHEYIYIEGDIPDLSIEGKVISIIKYDSETNGVYAIYEDAPITEIEKLTNKVLELETQNQHLTETLDMVLVDLIPSLLEGGEPV